MDIQNELDISKILLEISNEKKKKKKEINDILNKSKTTKPLLNDSKPL
jgi:hypothetical protein